MPADLRLVAEDPPGLDDGDDGGGDEGAVAVNVSIVGADDRYHHAGTSLPEEDADAETVALALIQVARAAACAFSPDVQLALEHRLLGWGRDG